MKLRRAGAAAGFSYKAASLSKQLKEASIRKVKSCIIIGEEFKNKELVVKDMATGRQQLIGVDEFFAQLESESK